MDDQWRREVVEYFKDFADMFHDSAREEENRLLDPYASGIDRELEWRLREQRSSIYREVGDKFDAIAEKIRADIGR